MLYHKQEHLVTKDNPIVRGSCYPTVLACLLDKPLHEVPYFHLFYWTQEEKDNYTKFATEKYCDGNYNTADANQKQNWSHNISIFLNMWYTVMLSWLASQGYKEEQIPNIEQWLAEGNMGVPYMVSGKSSRGVNHIVIYKSGILFHDPHPSNEGLLELAESPYSILVKI